MVKVSMAQGLLLNKFWPQGYDIGSHDYYVTSGVPNILFAQVAIG